MRFFGRIKNKLLHWKASIQRAMNKHRHLSPTLKRANRRLVICSSCEFRNGVICMKNNSNIKDMALGKKNSCPIQKWDK